MYLFLVALCLHCFAQAFSGGEQGYSSLLGVRFSLRWRLLLLSMDSGVPGLQELGLLGSRAQAQLLWCTGLAALWHLLGPGVEPASSALAGGFLTTELPGKPLECPLDLRAHSGLLVSESPLCPAFTFP